MPQFFLMSFILLASLLWFPHSAKGAEKWTGPKAYAYHHMIESIYADHVGVPLLQTSDLVESMTPKDAVILDTRTRPEFDVSHIQGAQWVGYESFELSRVDGISKDTPILVYCSIGYRSGEIAIKLREAGYKNVSNLYGGIFQWYNELRPVYHDSEPVNQIHPYDWMWGRWLARGEKVIPPTP